MQNKRILKDILNFLVNFILNILIKCILIKKACISCTYHFSKFKPFHQSFPSVRTMNFCCFFTRTFSECITSSLVLRKRLLVKITQRTVGDDVMEGFNSFTCVRDLCNFTSNFQNLTCNRIPRGVYFVFVVCFFKLGKK